MKRFLTIQSLNWHTQYKRNPETSHGVLWGLDCSALVALWFYHKSVTLHWPPPIFVAFQSRQKRIDKLLLYYCQWLSWTEPKTLKTQKWRALQFKPFTILDTILTKQRWWLNHNSTSLILLFSFWYNYTAKNSSNLDKPGFSIRHSVGPMLSNTAWMTENVISVPLFGDIVSSRIESELKTSYQLTPLPLLFLQTTGHKAL